MRNKNEVSVFLITGFLESGKTSLIKDTIEQPDFMSDLNTMLIICEEGIEEYDENFIKDLKIDLEYIENEEDMTSEKLLELSNLHNSKRVIIEYNGMWDLDKLELPENWIVYQQLTMIDANTFQVFYNNMRSLFVNMIKNTDLVICNRCEDNTDINAYQRIIKAINRNVQVSFENEEGEIEVELTEEDLPYNLNQEVVEIAPEDYGIWFLDVSDHIDRYVGKVMKFTAMVYKDFKLPKNYFVPGRLAMTCCEDDVAFLGYICKSRFAPKLKQRQWVTVTARVENEYSSEYGEKGPVLYAEFVEEAEPIKEYVQF